MVSPFLPGIVVIWFLIFLPKEDGQNMAVYQLTKWKSLRNGGRNRKNVRETQSREWVVQKIKWKEKGARGVMVIVVGNGHGDTSSNPGRGWLYFTEH